MREEREKIKQKSKFRGKPAKSAAAPEFSEAAPGTGEYWSGIIGICSPSALLSSFFSLFSLLYVLDSFVETVV